VAMIDASSAAATTFNVFIRSSQKTPASSAVDLKFLSLLRHARHRNFKSKPALES
jgi:hypothetical protein